MAAIESAPGRRGRGCSHGGCRSSRSARALGTGTGNSSNCWAKALPCGSMRRLATPPPPRAFSSRKLRLWLPGRYQRSTRPTCGSSTWLIQSTTASLPSASAIHGRYSGLLAITPMLLWLPLSPERATASLTSGTLASAWPAGAGSGASSAMWAGSNTSTSGRATGMRSPSSSTSRAQASLSTRKLNRRITGYTVGRPPTMPVRPGAMPVAAWAISRENSTSASFLAWRTASLITTSRVSFRWACGP